MSGFKLPWEEDGIKQIIDLFQCKVMAIEEVTDDGQGVDNKDGGQ